MPHDVVLNLAVTMFRMFLYLFLPILAIWWFKRMVID